MLNDQWFTCRYWYMEEDTAGSNKSLSSTFQLDSKLEENMMNELTPP